MASADLTPYVDLPLVDKDPQDLFDAAILTARATFPEWQPREGNIEVVLLEALAEMVAESVFAINRIPSSIAEVLISLYGIERDIGETPVVDLRFEMSGTQGYSIPEGTTVTVDLGDGYDPVTFATDTELVIPVGQSSGVVSATGDVYTADYNGLAAETLVEANEMLIYVNYVKTNSEITGGRDPEEDEDYLTRGVQRFQRLSTTLLLPKHFEAAALEFEYVTRAFCIDNYNVEADVDNNGPTGDDVGYVTVAVYGDGENVSAERKDELLAYFEANSMAALTVNIIDPTINTVDVTAVVKFDIGADIISVTQEITSALEEYLSPTTWDWGGLVRKNQIVSIITNTPGVDFVESLTTPAADQALDGVAPLVDAGLITITSA
jgi:uncharacterized phage protein gp47/JayE